MIWFLLLVICIIIFVYIAAPLYFKNLPNEESAWARENVIKAYREELKDIEKSIDADGENNEALTAQKSVLEKRLLESAAQTINISSKPKPLSAAALLMLLFAGTIGTYFLIGSPQLANNNALQQAVLTAPQALSQNTPKPQHENDASMEDLLISLERKLEANDGTLQQWGLYARSLMTVGRYEEAYIAYEKTLALSGNNPDIAAELKSAREFGAQQSNPASTPPPPGPSRDDVAAAAQMSPDDRAAMIQGMVDGLSEKLAENPDDPAGWIRLLRARKVLNQTSEAEAELKAMKAHFNDKPDLVAQILAQSGWVN